MSADSDLKKFQEAMERSRTAVANMTPEERKKVSQESEFAKRLVKELERKK